MINRGEEGAGLVFLPGKGEIEEAERLLSPVLTRVGWSCMTLHGQLPLEIQRKVVSQSTGRRVVLSTNIAETSLTLRDVTWVVDSGEVRRLRWDLDSGFESLLLESISRASPSNGPDGRDGFNLGIVIDSSHRRTGIKCRNLSPHLFSARIS